MRKKLIREILNARVRFFAISVVVAIGVMVFLASSMSYFNLDTSYKYTYQKLHFADFRVKSRDIPPHLVSEIRSTDGIEMVTPRVKTDQPISLADGKPLLGRITGLPPQRPIVDDLLVEKGRYFDRGESNACIAESHFAEFYDLRPGDTLYYSKKGNEIPIEIIGVASNPEYIMLAGERGDISPMLSATAMAILWMPIDDVQYMAGLPGAYNEVLCTVEDAEDLEEKVYDVEMILSQTGIREVVTRDEHLGNLMLEMDLDGFRSFALFFPILFLGVACFSIYILLSRMVHAQRPFIGVMRAMGYSRSRVLLHYFSFSLLIGVAGAVIGVIGGFLLSQFITEIYAETIGIPLVETSTHWLMILAGCLISLCFCSLAGIWPALKSSRLDPAQAMRGELEKKVFRKPLIERAMPFVKSLPMYVKLPFRNMFRNRRRTLFTVVGLAFSIMVVLLFVAILNTADHTLTAGFSRDNRFDMAAIFLGGADEQVRERELELSTGVVAEPVQGEDCTVTWAEGSREAVLMGVPIDTEMKGFYTPGGERIYLRARHALVNQWFRDQEGLEEGDEVDIGTSHGSKQFIVGGFLSEPLGNIVYIPLDEARDLLAGGAVGRSGFYLKVDQDSRETVTERIREMPGLMTVIDVEEIKREVSGYLDLLYIIVYTMLAFAVIMAFALTLNSITINVLEREREIATMRTLGTRPWKISAMVSLENILYGLLAVAPGILLGLLVARYSISLQQSEYFTLNLVVYGRSYLLVSLGILVLLLLSQVPSLRYVRKVELAEATKERLR